MSATVEAALGGSLDGHVAAGNPNGPDGGIPVQSIALEIATATFLTTGGGRNAGMPLGDRPGDRTKKRRHFIASRVRRGLRLRPRGIKMKTAMVDGGASDGLARTG